MFFFFFKLGLSLKINFHDMAHVWLSVKLRAKHTLLSCKIRTLSRDFGRENYFKNKLCLYRSTYFLLLDKMFVCLFSRVLKLFIPNTLERNKNRKVKLSLIIVTYFIIFSTNLTWSL